ncbi:hypothetical protein ACFCYN_22300 [Gottfriedia sp. NPDC056225]
MKNTSIISISFIFMILILGALYIGFTGHFEDDGKRDPIYVE